MSEKSGTSEINSVWSLIPSVYYDLIARFTPGIAMLLLIDDVRKGANEAGSAQVAIALILAYIVGILLTGMSSILLWPIRTVTTCDRLRKLGWLGRQLQLLPTKKQELFINDYVGLKRPESGATLAKMQAESVLCANITVAWILLPFFAGASAVNAWLQSSPRPIAMYSLVTMILFITANTRYVMWRGRQRTLYRQLKRVEKSVDHRTFPG
jgi:hypothetical protein